MSNSLPYFDDNLHITGPYLNKKQGRRFVTILDKKTGKRTQKTYAKYLIETYLCRQLTKEETVDHIDRDKLNDVIENLQILNQSNHSRLDNKRATKVSIPCGWCGKSIERSARHLRMRATRNQSGPFCSRSCRGKYGKHIQEGGEKFKIQPNMNTEYFYIDKKLK